MKHKVLITKSEREINNLLDDGWLVKSVNPQHIAGGGSTHVTDLAGFCFVLEKN